MFFGKNIKSLYRCDSCGRTIIIDVEDPKDIKDLREDNILLECSCGGICSPLRD